MTARRHRGRGEGSVYQDKHGTWSASVSLPLDPYTRKRPRRKMSAPDQETAKQHLRTLQAELEETGTVGAKNWTVAQAVADLMAHPPDTWKTTSTVAVNTVHAKNLTAGLGKYLLTRLSVQQVEDHLAAEVRRGLSRSALSRQLFLLRRVFRRAQKLGLVTRNVAELADLPSGLRTRRSRSMTPAEVGQLVASVRDDPWWTAYLTTAIECGMRPGELTGLTWDNVDFGKNTITITHALQRGPGGLQLGRLKNDWSGGVLPMPRNTRAALKALQKQQAAERLRLGPHYGGLGTVFCQPGGAPVSRQLLHTMFRDVTGKAGLGRDWQPRETRHTTVSLLDDAGQPIEDISALVRHKNSQVTKVTYRHQISRTPAARTAATMDGIDIASGVTP